MPGEGEEFGDGILEVLAADEGDGLVVDIPHRSQIDVGGGAPGSGEPSGGTATDSSAITSDITPQGPVEGEVLPEITIVGPPDFVLQDPELLPVWEDMKDGWDAAEAAVPPDGPRSDAFWAGWRGYVDSQQVTGPVADVAPPDGEPFVPAEDAIIEYLNHHHAPHTRTPTEEGPPEVVFE